MDNSETYKLAEKSNSWAFVEARNLRDRLNKLGSSAGLDGENPVLFETGYGPSGSVSYTHLTLPTTPYV